jgi:Phosphopantetheine attachment site
VDVETTQTGVIAPRTPSEILVADVWRSLLGVQQIGVLDNFLDLGGHSLLIMRAIAMLEDRTGKRLSPRAFIFQTLEQVARDYDSPPPAADEPAVGGLALVRRFLSALRPERNP